jgi:hypothetical protein
VHINRALLPGIFANIKGVEFLELSFGKQENVFGVMSRGSGFGIVPLRRSFRIMLLRLSLCSHAVALPRAVAARQFS